MNVQSDALTNRGSSRNLLENGLYRQFQGQLRETVTQPELWGWVARRVTAPPSELMAVTTRSAIVKLL